MIELLDLMKIGLSVILGLFIGYEREKSDKPCGIRTISFISLGATLVVVTTLKFTKFAMDFDAIRAVAYYLVAIGFVGGGIIGRKNGKVEGITTASLLLPMSIIGIQCGMGEYSLAIVSTLVIYFILKLKYIRITILKRQKRRRRKTKLTKGD